MSIEDIKKASRLAQRKSYVHNLREGRRQRAYTFRPKKGKGSYDRIREKNRDAKRDEE